MKTQLYKNLEKAFLVFHISSVHELDNLEKFVGGDVGNVNGGLVVATPTGAVSFKVGDYVVHAASRYGKSVPVEIDGTIHHVPQNSFMVCDAEDFTRNFKEMQ